jgi:hypothetical protein
MGAVHRKFIGQHGTSGLRGKGNAAGRKDGASMRGGVDPVGL